MEPDELQELQRQLTEVRRSAAEPDHADARAMLLTCPGCLQKIEVLPRYLDTRVVCTLCGKKFKASQKGEEKLEAELRRRYQEEAKAKARAEQLQQLQEVQESELPEQAAHGTVEDDGTVSESGGESIALVDHAWPFDHHRHPQGWPIRRYLGFCALVWVLGAGCWGGAAIATRVGPLQAHADLARLFAELAVLLGALVTFGTVGAIVSHGKGRPRREGFVFGFFLGPLGCVLAGLMPNHMD